MVIFFGLLMFLPSMTPIINADILRSDLEGSLLQNMGQTTMNDDALTFHYSFETPKISPIHKGNQVYDRVTINGLQTIQEPFLPVLPVKPLYILLPPNQEVKEISINSELKQATKNVNIEQGSLPLPISQRFTMLNQDCSDYANYQEAFESFKESINQYPEEIQSMANKFMMYLLRAEQSLTEYDIFPPNHYQNQGIHYYRGYPILILNVFPTQYHIESKELISYNEFSVTIKLKNNSVTSTLLRNNGNDHELVSSLVENPMMLSTYHETDQSCEQTFQSQLITDAEAYDYVIITSESLMNSVVPFTFQTLADYKIRNGINTKIVSVESITHESAYWDDNSLFNDTQAQIRNFIKDAYLNWGIEYVLLAGDGDDNEFFGELIIPARKVYSVYGEIPSDVYYSNLDGSFNENENNIWGEATDGLNGGDIDLIPDVYIGRAPVDSPEEMNNFVKKTLSYEYNYDPYVTKVLNVGEYLGFGGVGDFGGNYLDELIDTSRANGYTTNGIPSDEYDVSTIYDKDWPGFDKSNPFKTGWPSEELINFFEEGVYIINHLGHSSPEYNMKLTNGQIHKLQNHLPSFIYSQGCFAGSFDNPSYVDCAAEASTVESKHGAFAGIWNTRVGLGMRFSTDGPSQLFHREFWDAVFGEKFTSLGAANHDSKIDNIWRITDGTIQSQLVRLCYFEITLFGDPTVHFKNTDQPDHDLCISDIFPNYVRPNMDNKIMVAVKNNGRNDESNIQVKLTINDGDSQTKTISFLPKGEKTNVTFNHFFAPGIYTVKAEINIDSSDAIFSNNLFEKNVFASADVLVHSIEGIHPPFYINQTYSFQVLIENPSVLSVENQLVECRIDDDLIDTKTYSLEADSFTYLEFAFTPTEDKWQTISFTLLPAPDELESLTKNNEKQAVVHPISHTIVVNKSDADDFHSISNAVEWSGDNDTIIVHPDTYFESVEIFKTLDIVGTDAEQVIVESESSMGCFQIFAPGSRISNFTMNSSYIGISAMGSDLLIDHNRLLNSYFGVYLYSASDILVEQNTFVNNDYLDLYLFFSNDCKIRGNKMMNSTQSLIVSSNSNEFSDNVFKNVKNFDRNLWVMSSDNNLISQNIFQGDNKDENPISLSLSSNNQIISNTFLKNRVGVQLELLSKQNEIIHNNFIETEYPGWFSNTIWMDWDENYYDIWKGKGPMIIHGELLRLPWFTFDFHPSSEPFEY